MTPDKAVLCPFCRIIRGQDTSTRVLHDFPDVVAFEPLNPVIDGHLLVVPKDHVPDFATDPFRSAMTAHTAAWLARDLGGQMNVITSIGPEATQTVFHLHLHLVPRAAGDGLALPWTNQEGTP